MNRLLSIALCILALSLGACAKTPTATKEEGKTIIPFAISGGSDYGDTEKELRISAPKAKFLPGKVLNGMGEKEIRSWTEALNK